MKLMLGLSETLHLLVMADSVRWYSSVLGREVGDVLRKVSESEVEGQRRKWRLKGH